ncbi:MAG: ATP-binding cassette domain-containing protein [Eubacteriales bacterium]|nr:ATP-binding cassette domain-containing protein [Eubacteriales bacterium]
MEYVLETNAVTKRYRSFTALNGLTMRIPKGSVYGFVGRNGAGKTTLIRIICGLQEPTDGSYTLYGVKNTESAVLRSRRRMGAVVESPAIYLGMTAKENIRQQYNVLGIPSDEGAEELLRLVGLDKTGSKTARNFSLGMRQRLGIAVALAGNPDFLVLDEPTNGLDPQGIIEMRELILKLNREQGITVLISSHILDELSRLATHYGFIDNGRMVREMSAEELEACCRKCIRMEVSDTKTLARVLDSMNAEYRISDEHHADVYAEIPVTSLVSALAKENCTVKNIKEHDESLESFYMNLVGGERHA